jgi:hypothetical protein
VIAALEVVLLVLAGLFFAAWVLSTLGMIFGMRRLAKRSRSPLRWRDLSGVPHMAVLNAVNVVWFIGALGWHALLRRPLPPPPRPPSRPGSVDTRDNG